MRKSITVIAVVALVALAGTVVAMAGGFNWKENVRTDCKRLSVNARWVYKARHNPQLLENRVQRLKKTGPACRAALRTIPGN